MTNSNGFLEKMVLISITSDPYDFLSAPPPSLYSRQPGVLRPVQAINGRSNGNRTGNNDGAPRHVTTAPPLGSCGVRQSQAGPDRNDTTLQNSTAAKIKLSVTFNDMTMTTWFHSIIVGICQEVQEFARNLCHRAR